MIRTVIITLPRNAVKLPDRLFVRMRYFLSGKIEAYQSADPLRMVYTNATQLKIE